MDLTINLSGFSLYNSNEKDDKYHLSANIPQNDSNNIGITDMGGNDLYNFDLFQNMNIYINDNSGNDTYNISIKDAADSARLMVTDNEGYNIYKFNFKLADIEVVDINANEVHFSIGAKQIVEDWGSYTAYDFEFNISNFSNYTYSYDDFGNENVVKNKNSNTLKFKDVILTDNQDINNVLLGKHMEYTLKEGYFESVNSDEYQDYYADLLNNLHLY